MKRFLPLAYPVAQQKTQRWTLVLPGCLSQWVCLKSYESGSYRKTIPFNYDIHVCVYMCMFILMYAYIYVHVDIYILHVINYITICIPFYHQCHGCQ